MEKKVKLVKNMKNWFCTSVWQTEFKNHRLITDLDLVDGWMKSLISRTA
jgi:hypothetical protein